MILNLVALLFCGVATGASGMMGIMQSDAHEQGRANASFVMAVFCLILAITQMALLARQL